MAKNAASESKLGSLHEKVAKVMTDALDVHDKAQEKYLNDDEAVYAPVLSAPLLSVITKFLSDNKITCAPEESKGLSTLEQKLKNRHRVGNVVQLRDEA